MLKQINRFVVTLGVVLTFFCGAGAMSAFAQQGAGAPVTSVSHKAEGSFRTGGSDATLPSEIVGLSLFPQRPTPNQSRVFWNGKFSYLLGANYAWWNYGTDFGTGEWGKFTNWTDINTNFAVLNSQGVRVIRWWVFSDCRYAPEFNADGTVSGLDAQTLADVDKALQAAHANNVYLIFTVLDFLAWHPASFDGTLQMGGRTALVTSPTVQQSFLDKALKPLLQHVAQSPYRKRVLAYDIVNEPEINMAGYWGGANLSVGAVKTFVQRSAAYIHKYGGGAYATLGSLTPFYVSTWKNLGLDFYQFHYYTWTDGNNGAGSGLPTYASLGLDRPCIVGEYATACASYGATDTAPLSAKWYLDAIYAKGYAGSLGWSLTVGDGASNWPAFHPVLKQWSQSHQPVVGPQ